MHLILDGLVGVFLVRFILANAEAEKGPQLTSGRVGVEKSNKAVDPLPPPVYYFILCEWSPK